MKKLLALAIAALSVCAAQAITVTWTFTNSTFYDTGTQNIRATLYSGALSTATSTATTEAFTITNSASYLNMAQNAFGTVLDTTTGVTALVTNISSSGNNTSYTASTTISSVSAGTYTLLVGDAWWLNGQSGTASTVSSPSYAKFIEFTITADEAVMLNTTPDASITIAVDGANFQSTTNDAALTGVTVTVAPEPTVLALLALGVAGIALKRRA